MRQDSESELAGKLGASLTPRVARASTPRGQQNSGMFDLHSLYTVQVEQMQAPLVLPVPRIAPPLRVPTMRAPQVVPAMDAYEVALRRAMPRPIGWYAVFVTWLATVTLAAAAATQVPAHVSARMHPMVAIATPTAPAAATASATAAATPTATAAATATGTATATPTPSSSVPEFVISELPRVTPKAVAAPTHAKWVAPPPQRAVEEPPAKAAPKPAPTPEPVAAAPAPAPTPAPAPPAAKPATPALSTPLSTGGTLEDLIRREVAAEQKKVKAAKGSDGQRTP